MSLDLTLTEENCYETYRRWIVVGVNRALTYTIGSFSGRAQNIIDLVVYLGTRQKVLRIEDAHTSAFWSDNNLLLWLALIGGSELALHLLGVRLGNWNHFFVVFLWLTITVTLARGNELARGWELGNAKNQRLLDTTTQREEFNFYFFLFSTFKSSAHCENLWKNDLPQLLSLGKSSYFDVTVAYCVRIKCCPRGGVGKHTNDPNQLAICITILLHTFGRQQIKQNTIKRNYFAVRNLFSLNPTHKGFSILFKRVNYHILLYYITNNKKHFPIESCLPNWTSCLANQCGKTKERVNGPSRVASLIELKRGLSIK